MGSIHERTSFDLVQDAIVKKIEACHKADLLDSEQDDCFFVADLGEVRRQYETWQRELNVHPSTVVKLNSNLCQWRLTML